MDDLYKRIEDGNVYLPRKDADAILNGSIKYDPLYRIYKFIEKLFKGDYE